MASLILVLLLFPPLLHLLSIAASGERKVEQIPNAICGFAIIITAYRNLEIAKPLVVSALAQNYKDFHIYVVADFCEGHLLLEDPRLTVIYPPLPLHSKVASIELAMNSITGEGRLPYVVILDPDNVLAPDFLLSVNAYVSKGFRVIQAERIAKNLDSDIARLDAAIEAYHNYMDKELLFRLTGGALLSGSGMAVEAGLMDQFLHSEAVIRQRSRVILGEDKMMQNFFIEQDIPIAYAAQIKVQDEKVVSGHQLQRQRTRWFATYFKNTSEALKHIFRGVKNADKHKFLLGLVLLYPPVTLLMVASLIVAGLSILTFPALSIYISTALLLFGINFLWVLYLKKMPREVFLSLVKAPYFMLIQLSSLLHLKQTKDDFLYTEKSIRENH